MNKETELTKRIAQIIDQWNTNTLPEWRTSMKKTGSTQELAEYMVFELGCDGFRIGDKWPEMDRDWGDGHF